MPELRAPRRIPCPVPGYESASVTLPAEWLGAHWLRHGELQELAQSRFKNQTMVQVCITLGLLDDWDGIPGITDNCGPGPFNTGVPVQKNDPATWDIPQVPITLLLWLATVALPDFYDAFNVPKASALPLPNG